MQGALTTGHRPHKQVSSYLSEKTSAGETLWGGRNKKKRIFKNEIHEEILSRLNLMAGTLVITGLILKVGTGAPGGATGGRPSQ